MSVVRWKFLENMIDNFSFEFEDAENSGLARDWTKEGSPTISLVKQYVKEGTYSQKIVTSSSTQGISQECDVSDFSGTDCGLIFYAKIEGDLQVDVDAFDSDGNNIGNVFTEQYETNTVSTKYSETFDMAISGETIASLEIKFIHSEESGANNVTLYLDAVILYEDEDTEVSVNPTTFNFSKISTANYTSTLDGADVKVEHLDEAMRIRLDNITPVWMRLYEAQLDIFKNLISKDVVIIDHNDDLYWVDIQGIDITYIPKTVPQEYGITMNLKFANR